MIPHAYRILLALLFPVCLQAAATSPNPGLKYYYPAPEVPVVDIEADIIVYGGTSGGVVAAVQAARMGKSVALIVFGRHVGGMTSGGLTQTDAVSSSVQGGITREFFSKTGSSGFKPSEAELAFEELLADPVPGQDWDAAVPVYYEQRIDSVELDGARIVALHMENGSVFRGRMFIDCSYEGDLMARAGIPYTWGREPGSQYDESRAGSGNPGTLSGVNAYVTEGDPASGLIFNVIDEPAGTPGSGDDHVQAYNFRMYTVQTSDPTAMQPLFEPSAYDPSMFEILYRYHRAGGDTKMTVGNDINNHEMFHRATSTDHIGGNRWPDGSGGWIPWADADYATRELIYQSHVAWQLGMLWYIKTDARYRALATDPSLSLTTRGNIQALLDKVDQLGLPLGEYTETGGWSHELYVREARRMVSDFVVTQAWYDREIVAEDPVGLANYRADSHHVRRILGPGGSVLVEGDTGGSGTTPWRIPYRSLIPPKAQCENLLVSWAISASHVAFCSMRMEPCLMVLSQSAATAAALCIDRGEAVQDLPYPTLKLHLLAGGQILGDEAVPDTGIIVDNADASGVTVTGAWNPSSASPGFYGSNYLHDGDTGATGGKAVSFVPTLPTTEDHDVFLRWASDPNRADNVPVDIIHAGGTNTVTVNQKTNGGTWVLLGRFPFTAGATAGVVVRNDGTNGYVIADSVRFLPESTPPPNPGRGIHAVASDPVAEEDTGAPASFRIVRDTDTFIDSVTVHYSVAGSAVPGVHYTPLSGSVTVPGGSRSAAVYVTPIPDTIAQGGRTVTLTVLPDAAYAVGSQPDATVTIRDKPYDAWRHHHFAPENLENAAASEPTADPEKDGRINLLEFVLGSNPLDGAGEFRPDLALDANFNTFTFSWWHRGHAQGVAATGSYSETLEPGSWSPIPDEPQIIDWDPATGDKLLRQSLPMGDRERCFFNLTVE